MLSTSSQASAKQWTYADYCDLDDEERYEIMEGKLIPISAGLPGPGRQHVEATSEIFAQISHFLRGKPCRAYHAPCDVILPDEGEDDDQAHTVLQPDIFVLCDLSKFKAHGCVGAPDMAIEVLSPYSISRDICEKKYLYEKHGVQEYWIVDPANHVVYVYLLEEGHYREVIHIIASSRSEPITCSVLPGLAVDMQAVFDRML